MLTGGIMKKYKYWDIKEIHKTNDELVTAVELRDNNYNDIQLDFKWDGCINMWKYYNGYTPDDDSEEVQENMDYLHICDLQKFINQLQEVLTIAKDILGEEKFERDFI